MNRREWIKLGGMALAQAAAARVSPAQSSAMPGMPQAAPPQPTPDAKADYTLRIAPVTVELDPAHILSTIGYNGSAPGPVLRMRAGSGRARLFSNLSSRLMAFA